MPLYILGPTIMSRLSFANVFQTMTNAYGDACNDVNATADTILRDQQIFEELIHFSRNVTSTPNKKPPPSDRSDIKIPSSS